MYWWRCFAKIIMFLLLCSSAHIFSRGEINSKQTNLLQSSIIFLCKKKKSLTEIVTCIHVHQVWTWSRKMTIQTLLCLKCYPEQQITSRHELGVSSSVVRVAALGGSGQSSGICKEQQSCSCASAPWHFPNLITDEDRLSFLYLASTFAILHRRISVDKAPAWQTAGFSGE